jgi:non-canonical purine NTP pyrophosphatase (RdgB/HAM1 family)
MNNSTILLLATKNQHKINEIKKILNLDIEYRSLSEYVDIEVQEAGRTLLENSLAKAAFAYKVARIPALADDSGLFVDNLNGEPGVFSSRYGKDDVHRIARVLQQLETKTNRRASFKAVFVYYYGFDRYETFEGICLGTIAEHARGEKGFGYDPIFIPDGHTKTFAELGSEVKNTISHRARALAKFKAYIKIKQ